MRRLNAFERALHLSERAKASPGYADGDHRRRDNAHAKNETEQGAKLFSKALVGRSILGDLNSVRPAIYGFVFGEQRKEFSIGAIISGQSRTKCGCWWEDSQRKQAIHVRRFRYNGLVGS